MYIVYTSMVIEDEMDTGKKSWNKTNMKIQNNYFVYTSNIVKKYYTNRKTIKKSKHVSIKKKEETNPQNPFVLHDQYTKGLFASERICVISSKRKQSIFVTTI